MPGFSEHNSQESPPEPRKVILVIDSDDENIYMERAFHFSFETPCLTNRIEITLFDNPFWLEEMQVDGVASDRSEIAVFVDNIEMVPKRTNLLLMDYSIHGTIYSHGKVQSLARNPENNSLQIFLSTKPGDSSEFRVITLRETVKDLFSPVRMSIHIGETEVIAIRKVGDYFYAICAGEMVPSIIQVSIIDRDDE